MRRTVRLRWVGLGIIALGVLGVAMAVTAMLTALPSPAAGGTCGPGRGSETALQAFVDPGSIGAGVMPPPSAAAAHAQWLAFVGECQAATDSRVLGAFGVLVLAIVVGIVGILVYRRAQRDPGRATAVAEEPEPALPDPGFAMGSSTGGTPVSPVSPAAGWPASYSVPFGDGP